MIQAIENADPLVLMETLKVGKARGQAEACWKSFKERTLTKKNARENLLLNSDFNHLLNSLLHENNDRALKIAFDFVLKCIEGKLISPTALLTLIQQKLPQANVGKIVSMPVLERAASFFMDMEARTGVDFSFQLASSDLRMIPFVTEKLIAHGELDYSSNFVNYLLGHPELCFTKSVFEDSHFKLSRCRILSFLAENVGNERYAELLIAFMVWNSSRPCVLEMSNLFSLAEFFAKAQTLSDSHVELFEVYIETLCNGLVKFGIFSETIEYICRNADFFIDESVAFRIGSLLLLTPNPNICLVKEVLGIIRKFRSLSDLSNVICSHLMMKLATEDDEELLALMKSIFAAPSQSSQIEIISDSFNDFGVIVRLGNKCLRPSTAIHETYFDLIELSRNLNNISVLDMPKLMKRGHFETLFGLLSYKWACADCDYEALTEGFLNLLGDVEGEETEGKVLRYSWVVDFFETNFNDQLYLEMLPLICDSVSSSDNILFAFVQQKISNFLSQKENVSVQVPCMISLLSLFESSQSRQSRLNFLTTSALSYLHNITQGNIAKVESLAVFICFKLLGSLCDIAVIDPRDIWSKYIIPILDVDDLVLSAHIRGAVSSFCASLRIIPEGPTGELNEIKVSAVRYLLEKLSNEDEVFVIEMVCEALSKFNVENLRIIEIHLLKPMSIEDEPEKEASAVDLLSNSIIFNPALLFEVSKSYKSVGLFYKQLWTALVEHEVETMSRTIFLGSNEAAKSKTEQVNVKYISNPSFCNGLLFEIFDGLEINCTADAVKCIKSRLCPLIPSVNTLLWYVRSHLPIYILDSVKNILKKIDDQRITKELSAFEFLLSELRTGNTPQASCNLIMTISALMKCFFTNHIISENNLFLNWISVLAKRLGEMSEFKSLMGNEEFLACLAVSCNILSGCSVEIDSTLSDLLLASIVNNSKLKDGVAVYCAIESLSILNGRHVQTILADKSSSGKRKLIGIFALQRLKCQIDTLAIPEKTDDISLILETVANRGSSDAPKTFADPLEFKGLGAYVQSLHSPEDLKEKSKQRAFDTGNVPASLKFDSIWSYLLGSKLELLEMNSDCKELRLLESSTKDPKCLALLQMLSKSSSNESTSQVSIAGLGRFDQFSWLKFVSNTELRYQVLKNCKLLPRISWEPVSITNFEFILKHVLSITPITNVPYINPSLLPSFLKNASIFAEAATEEQLSRIFKILNNNSDEKSSHLLVDVLKDSIQVVSSSDRLNFILKEYKKYSANALKSFDFDNFNNIGPEGLAENSEIIIEFANFLGIEESKLIVFDFKNDLFGVLKTILNSDNFEKKLIVLALEIETLNGKQKLKCSVEIIDMMFVYQKDEDKFSLLLRLLDKVFDDIDMILLDAKDDLVDPELSRKIRSRAAMIPQDIYIRLEFSIAAFEFEKESF